MLCDPLDGLDELQAKLIPWCEQQRITTELQRWRYETIAALPDFHEIKCLIHGDTMRSEALPQANIAALLNDNIIDYHHFLASLPEMGVSLLLSSHLAAERHVVAGATLASAEALVAHWAAIHPSCPVQVWRLPSAFDPQATSTAMAVYPSAACFRERLDDALIDQLVGVRSYVCCQRLLAEASPLSVDRPLLRSQPLADSVVWPAQQIQAWLARLAESLACYDNQVVLEALSGLWT